MQKTVQKKCSNISTSFQYLYVFPRFSSRDLGPIFNVTNVAFFRLKDRIDFHLFITTSPCGDARIFSLHESSSATPEPKPKSPEAENEEKDSKEENSKEDETPSMVEKETSDEGVVLDDENNNLEVKEDAKEADQESVVAKEDDQEADIAKDDSKEELVKEEVKEEEIDPSKINYGNCICSMLFFVSVLSV